MSRFFEWALNAVYLALLVVASPWILWAMLRRGKYRDGFAEKVLGRAPRRQEGRVCVWLHAVSVGEVMLLDVTIRELIARRPELEIVISTTTRTGYELAKQKHSDHVVFYCPLDFSWAVRAAMRRIHPHLLVLMELELWPNLIRAARAHGARIAIVNGRLSDSSHRGYSRIRPVIARVLGAVDLVAAQDESTAERFRSLGATSTAVFSTGSLKFDGVVSDRDNPRTQALRRLAGISDADRVFLAGSTQAPEEQMALDAYREAIRRCSELRLIIVPRHPERFEEAASLIQQSGFSWARRSKLSECLVKATLDGGRQADCRSQPPTAWQVLLVDTVGELDAWWGAANIGLVGGSFGDRGGQNMIEPAAYGVAVCFGPNTWNFRDIVQRLLKEDAAVVVQNQDELTAFVQRSLDDCEYAESLSRRASQCVADQQGAAARTADAVCRLLPPAADAPVIAEGGTSEQRVA